MKRSKKVNPPQLRQFSCWLSVAIAVVGVGFATSAGAQTMAAPQAPPSLPAPVRAETDGAYAVASAVVGGAERLYRGVRPEDRGATALEGLREGQVVAVHYRAAEERGGAESVDLVGNEGLQVTEGTVTRVNRRQETVTIRFDDHRTETFRLADQEVGAGGGDANRVLLYYPNAAGEKVGHTFARISVSQPASTR
jgi:hypothetical protein